MNTVSAIGDFLSRKRSRFLPLLIVLLVTLSTYLPVLRNGFVLWDDDEYIIENIHIRNLDWSLLKWSFTEFVQGNWHPLTSLSHAVDYAIWGLDPFGHHLSALIFHLCNTLLVFLLASKLLGRRESLPSGFITVAAAVAALLFGIHPIHVESVAWAAERKDLLCALFYLLAIHSYLCRADKFGKQAEVIAGFQKWLLPALAFTLLATMSKPMAVTLPLVLLLLDYYLLARIDSAKTLLGAVLEKLPFFAVSALVSVATIVGQHKGVLTTPVEPVPLYGRALVALKAFFAYLQNIILPVGLSPIYPYPNAGEITIFSWHYALPLVAATAVLIYLVKGPRRGWEQGLWLYYLVTLLPVIGIIQVGHQFMADRYSYLPSIAPFLAIGIAAGWLWEKYTSAIPHRLVMTVLAITIVTLLSLSTVQQLSVWHDSVTFWSHIIEKDPMRVPFAYINRGVAYRDAHELDKAVADLDRAVELLPTDFKAYNCRGLVYAAKGDNERALADFDRAIKLFPGDPSAFYNRGAIFRKLGDFNRALADYNTALAMKPHDLKALNNRGLLFQDRGEYALAMADFNAALAVSPDDWTTLNNRGLFFNATGKLELALRDLNRAVKIKPDESSIYVNRGLVYRAMGLEAEAMPDFDRAISLNPNDGRAYNNRAIGYAGRGDLASAVKDLTNAIELEPSLAAYYLNRGAILMKLGDESSARADFASACTLGDPKGCAMSVKAR